MTKKTTKRALVVSILSLILCFTMLIGTTFAWFTDSVKSGKNRIVAGNLDVELEYLKDGEWETVGENTNVFEDGTLWEPGHTEVVYLKVRNAGTLALKYKLGVNVASEVLSVNVKGELLKLSDYIMVGVVDGQDKAFADRNAARAAFDENNAKAISEGYAKNGELVAKGKGTSEEYVALVVYMPESVGNEANYKTGEKTPEILLGIDLYAAQLMAEEDSFGSNYDENAQYPTTTDTWDGTVDTSWYNDTDTEFIIYTAEQLAGLAELVDGGNSFTSKTIKLGGDLDLYYVPQGTTEPKSFDPIGDDSPFSGTFDGQGHTIENLYQSGWAFGYEWGRYGSIGLFGELESATVKNVTISGAESFVEGGDVGGITGSATGNCVFENITLEDSVFATYNNGNGGIIGWSGAGNYTFKNITLAEDVVLAGLWGSFDSSIGGIVGQGEPGATYNFENVDIACRIDAYNDCTASYDYYNYRMCGMIIGRLAETTTIDGVNYPDASKYNITCSNVTVTYGDWMNYHYCEPTPGLNGGRGMRVEPGYAYDGLPADFDHTQCTTNHNALIPFDQIFGGDQLGVKGLKTYDGVTVVYPNN